MIQDLRIHLCNSSYQHTKQEKIHDLINKCRNKTLQKLKAFPSRSAKSLGCPLLSPLFQYCMENSN